MCVLELKSTAWKPTRSIVGAIETMSSVVNPVALHRLWLPSRVVVSTIPTTLPSGRRCRDSGRSATSCRT